MAPTHSEIASWGARRCFQHSWLDWNGCCCNLHAVCQRATPRFDRVFEYPPFYGTFESSSPVSRRLLFADIFLVASVDREERQAQEKEKERKRKKFSGCRLARLFAFANKLTYPWIERRSGKDDRQFCKGKARRG